MSNEERRLALWGGKYLGPSLQGPLIGHSKSGRHYLFIEIVIREKDLRPCFTYRDYEKGLTWMRPVCDLFLTESDGRPKWIWSPKFNEFFNTLRDNYTKHLELEEGDHGTQSVDSVGSRSTL